MQTVKQGLVETGNCRISGASRYKQVSRMLDLFGPSRASANCQRGQLSHQGSVKSHGKCFHGLTLFSATLDGPRRRELSQV